MGCRAVGCQRLCDSAWMKTRSLSLHEPFARARRLLEDQAPGAKMLLGLVLFFEIKHRSILRQGKFTTYLCGVGVGQFSSSFKHFYGSSRVSSRVFAFIIRERTMLSLHTRRAADRWAYGYSLPQDDGFLTTPWRQRFTIGTEWHTTQRGRDLIYQRLAPIRPSARAPTRANIATVKNPAVTHPLPATAQLLSTVMTASVLHSKYNACHDVCQDLF